MPREYGWAVFGLWMLWLVSFMALLLAERLYRLGAEYLPLPWVLAGKTVAERAGLG